MSEDDAKGLVESIVGSRSVDVLARLAALVLEENDRQNLIARSTVGSIWVRHILDSVQLLTWAGSTVANLQWLDIGSGGGFPGLAIATVYGGDVILVEPRRKRAEFLGQAASALKLSNVRVISSRVETMPSMQATTISARAVAPAATIFGMALQCATKDTRWLLPRGARHENDLNDVRACWKGLFHVEQSLTDPAAGILVGTQVAPL